MAELPGVGPAIGRTDGDEFDDELRYITALQQAVQRRMLDEDAVSEAPGFFSAEEDKAIAAAVIEAYMSAAVNTPPGKESAEEIGRAYYNAVLRVQNDFAEEEVMKNA